MKKTLLTFIIFALAQTGFAQVAINTDGSSPNNNAMLDIQSSAKGVLISRMTTTQRTAFGATLNTADAGMMVYDTDLKGIFVFDGSTWISATSYWKQFNDYVFNTTDSIGIGTATPGSELDVQGHIWQSGTGHSVFLGKGAGENDDFSSNYNTLIGNLAGYNNKTGKKNIAIGHRALYHSSKNSNLIAIGDSALYYADSSHIQGQTYSTFPKNIIAIGNSANRNQLAGEGLIVIGHSAVENGGIFESIIIGDSALTSGHADSSVVIGNKALFNNIHNEYYPHASVIIGNKAMYNFGNWASGGTSSDFSQNIVIGTRAFYNLTWGEHNVAMGRHVGDGITWARDNVAIGDYALSYLGTPASSEPRYNVSIGNSSGRSTTDNMYNTSVGYGAGTRVKFYNVAVGYQALGGGLTNLIENNIAIGAAALYQCETNDNIGIGYQALQNNGNGSQNLALGYRAGVNSSGSNNIFIGLQAGQDETGSNVLYIGNTFPVIKGNLSTGDLIFNGQIKINGGNPGIGKVLTSDANGLATWEIPDPAGAYEINDLTDAIYDGSSLFLGHGAGTHDDNSNDNTAIGKNALWTNVSGIQNVAIGENAGYQSTGNGNVFVGYNAGNQETGNNKLYIANSGTSTPLIGGDFSTSQVDINGTLKITGGSPGHNKVLTSDANGLASWENTVQAINDLSDAKTTTGSCVFLGLNAGASVTTGTGNTGLGSDALNAVTGGSQNTALGYHALKNNISGNGNTATGFNAISTNTSGGSNTAIGYYAGFINSTGSGNVFLGFQAGYNETGSNKLYIANSNTTTPLIGGDFSAAQLDINGTIKITGGNPGNGKILTSDANGLASWGTAPVSASGSIDTHSDVDVSTTTPLNGQVLGWNGTKWIPANDENTTYTAGTGLALTGTVFSLNSGINNLTDVDVSTNSPASGQVLSWDGTNWVPAADAIGAQSISDLTDGINDNSSLFLGTYAGINDDATSNLNIGLGTSALKSNTTGSENTVVGAEALYNNISGNTNTAIGRGAGLHSTGSGNVFIGYRAGNNETGDNKLYIANSATTSPLIGGNFSSSQVYINGTIMITGGSPGAGKVLTSDIVGNASWETPATPAIAINDLTDGLTTGNSVFLGSGSGNSNGTLMGNTGTGNSVLFFNNSGINNSAFGAGALAGISSGNNNTAIGYMAGVYDAAGNQVTDLNSDIFIGSNTKPLATSDTNTIVIGRFAVGLGNNTVVIGNDDIDTTALYGKVGIGTTTPHSRLQVSGGVQVANDNDAATADKAGTIRYRSDNNNSYVEMCVQTGASSYAWVILHQETW